MPTVNTNEYFVLLIYRRFKRERWFLLNIVSIRRAYTAVLSLFFVSRLLVIFFCKTMLS